MKNEKKTITCRICLQCDEKYISLFESYNDYFISDKINSIANVEIKQGDGLPDKICCNCLPELENAIAFKLKCESSDAILRNTVLGLGNTKGVELNDMHVKQEVDIEYAEILDHSDVASLPDLEKVLKKDKNYNEFLCDDCNGVFKSKCKLRVHWKKIHKPEKLLCPLCKRLFKSYKAFNTHTKKKLRSCTTATKARIEGQGRSRIFHCIECSYHTKRIKDLSSHLTVHTGDRQYQCNKCLKAFTQQSSLQAHQESVHKKYLMETTCQYCGEHIKGRNRFYRHLKRHTQACQQCELCKKILKNKKCLMMHMERHGTTKRFTCEICARTFYTLAELCNHRTRVHEKQKRFKCDLCEYTVYTSSRLKIHMAKHTDTNVPCLICGIFVENADMLVVHQKRHFDRHYPCHHCEKSFYSRKSRSKHISAKHRKNLVLNKVIKDSGTDKARIKEESPVENKCGEEELC